MGRNEFPFDQAGLNDFILAEAPQRVVIRLVAEFSAIVLRCSPNGLDRTMLRNHLGQRDRQRIPVGDCGLLGGRNCQHQLNQVFIRENGRILKHGNRDGFDILGQLQGNFTWQDWRIPQGDGQCPAHKIGRIICQDRHDLVGERFFTVTQHIERNASANPVRH